MRTKSILCLVPLILAIGAIMPDYAEAYSWQPVGSKGTVPYLDPVAIQVGAADWFSAGYTVVVVQGDAVTLTAISKDKDTRGEYIVACPPYTKYTGHWDSTDIVWSSDGGGLPAPLRRSSGSTITFTAPTLGPSETSRTIKITATPDDNTTAAPGNRPAGDVGNRNDDPGTGTTYIYFKVIKVCPTTASLGSSCTVPHATWFASGYKTSGFTTVQTIVSGGTPPNPPNNWNGMFIKEWVALHPTNPGTGVDDDFEVAGYRASSCTATVQGFVVGFGPGTFANCPRAAATDRFWDDHSRSNQNTVLKEGKPDKTVICQQKYYCKTTQLNTAGANNAFKITSTYHENTYDPDGGGPLAAYRVTEVTITKATD